MVRYWLPLLSKRGPPSIELSFHAGPPHTTTRHRRNEIATHVESIAHVELPDSLLVSSHSVSRDQPCKGVACADHCNAPLKDSPTIVKPSGGRPPKRSGSRRRGLCVTQSTFSSPSICHGPSLATMLTFHISARNVSLKIMLTSPARLASFDRPGFIGNHVITQIDQSEDDRVPRARSESTLTSILQPCAKGRAATCK